MDSLQANYAHAVKPTGSLRDTLLIVSSYPTAKEDSTVYRSYSTTLDISNESMFMLYAKLGHNVSLIRNHSALHLDVFPRRVDRNIALGLRNIVDQVPTNLGMYWRLVLRQLIESSHSKTGSPRRVRRCCHVRQLSQTKQHPLSNIWLSNKSVQGY